MHSASSPAEPANCLPPWGKADLPEPAPLSWRNWAGFIGPGIVMMGIQIGGGEWLFGPVMTAQYGGGLMWIATISIVLQVFYNIECGRYALYCGEPVMTGFMRKRPGPRFWVGVMLLLSLSAFIPGLSSHAAVVIASLILDRPPVAGDQTLVIALSFLCMLGVTLPVLIGGKVYNMLQAVMMGKVIIVLSFCLIMGLFFVRPEHWLNVFSGFLKFGHLPVSVNGKETAVSLFGYVAEHGTFPPVSLSNIAIIGAFAGYAGGGGLSNSTYSNFVRDKGWGMGRRVGAIPSAVGGRHITLSHVGKTFPLTAENLRRWSGWWRYIMTDQFLIWAPGCFMGMALPALLSLQFAEHSPLYEHIGKPNQPQAILTADGIRHAPQFHTGLGVDSGQTTPGSTKLAKGLWVLTLLVGLAVFLPSQMSVVEDFSRRWTDTIWSSNQRVRETMHSGQVKYIYYTLLFSYVLWTFVVWAIFSWLWNPGVMVAVIANFNNLAIGVTSLLILRINRTLLPPQLRPRWYHQTGILCCGLFYVGLFILVFVTTFGPMMQKWVTNG